MSSYESFLFPRPDLRAKYVYVAKEPVPYTTHNFVRFGPVPKIVHQIWIKVDEQDSKPIPDHVNRWREYCKAFGYGYKLWTEIDILLIEEMLRKDGTYESFMKMRHFRYYKSMSDILRYTLLLQVGGVYLDCDFPCRLDKPMDEYFFFDNMTLMTERYCRNVNQDSGHFFHTSIMIASQDHPILKRIVQSIPQNIEQTQQFGNEWIMTGPMLVNRCVYGTFHIIPFNYTWLDHPFDCGDKKDDPWAPLWE